jgi:hypothetical protein
MMGVGKEKKKACISRLLTKSCKPGFSVYCFSFLSLLFIVVAGVFYDPRRPRSLSYRSTVRTTVPRRAALYGRASRPRPEISILSASGGNMLWEEAGEPLRLDELGQPSRLWLALPCLAFF